MELTTMMHNNYIITHVSSPDIVIREAQDALDLIGNSHYQGSTRVILHEENFAPEFFDLKTKVAGDILQKFTNYNVQIAIIGDFSKYKSASLQAFIRESNKTGKINFVNDLAQAVDSLS